MQNDRPIQNRKLQRALNKVQALIANEGFAGAVMLVSRDEATWGYVMHAPWSAIRYDPATPMGFRIRASTAVDGKDAAHSLLEAAAHTICSLSDFGYQTTEYMDQLRAKLHETGLEIEHTPFNGRVLRPLVFVDPKSGSPPG